MALPRPMVGHLSLENVSFSYAARAEAQECDNRHTRGEKDESWCVKEADVLLVPAPANSGGDDPAAGGPIAGQLVLKGLSLEIPAGQRVAIIGPSGEGKTTLLRLLSRAYDPTEGSIKVDGQCLRTLQLHSLRSQMATVNQETFVFNDSLRENLVFGAGRKVSDDEVWEACKLARCAKFIQALPSQLDTMVGERGLRLSGGQRQRISLARAFLARPSLLLLDEPTSAVEPEAEADIIAAITTLMRGLTTVLVSHRLALARASDRVLVLRGGRIVEDGAPEALLMDRNSIFSGMWSSDLLYAADVGVSSCLPSRSI